VLRFHRCHRPLTPDTLCFAGGSLLRSRRRYSHTDREL
jgi:hypothetical protein